MMGIKVVRDADGGPVTMGSAILRLLGYWVSGLVFYLGYIWIFIDKRKRGWFDLIAGTVVVKAAEVSAPRRPSAAAVARGGRCYPDRRRGGRAVDGGALEKR